MVTVSALATTLFLGGWRAPWPISAINDGMFNTGYWPVLWFLAKVMIFIFIFIWLRGTLPRLRYDQFMKFGWKVLIPVSLVWIMLAAAMRLINTSGGIDRRYLFAATAVVLVLALVLTFVGEKDEQADDAEDEEAEFDAFAGGYPVPPMSSALPSSRSGVPSSVKSTVGKSDD